MAGLTPLPTHIHHSSTRLSHRAAHTFLSEFLEKAENDAAYRPDSTLSERGPQSSSTGANPNLTLHHLKRILQGIEGKRVGGEDAGRFFGENVEGGAGSHGGKRSLDDSFASGASTGATTPKKRPREVIDDGNLEDSGPEITIADEGDGWQDKDDYDLAQDGGLDPTADQRHPDADLEQPSNIAEEFVELEDEEIGEKIQPREEVERHAVTAKVDKEERKRQKKQRRKEEKQTRAEEKAKKG